MLITYGDVDPVGLRCVGTLLDDNVCRSAVHMQRTESTNTVALHDCATGIDHDLLPRLYVADEQRDGQGRHGRRWHSSESSLTLSLVICDDRPSALLPIAIGVGVARSIEFTYAPLRARLKWPNDVYINQGKVAGILVETNHSNPDRVVIGVGVNVSSAPELSDLTAEAAPQRSNLPAQPKSIAGAIGRPVSRYEILPSLVTCMTEAIKDTRESASTILGEFRTRCLLTDQQITFASPDGPATGTCLGITDGGELAVRTVAGIHHCRSGKVCRVRVQTRTPPV